MKKKLIFLFCLIFILIPSIVTADLIAPGTKYVYYSFKISNMDEYPEYTFIAYFQNPVGGHEVIEQGESISFYKFSNPKIYAIKKSDFNEEDIGTDDLEEKEYFENNTKLIPSEIVIYSVSSASLNDPVEKITDILEIVNLDDNNLEIRYSKVQYTYVDETTEELDYQTDDIRPEPSKEGIMPMLFARFWYVILPIMALVAIALILVLRKRRKK